ncbi:hypothetical protein DFA_01545 [Cavenderia fasciculata]|uniref:RNA helicase n=1 Tax=Cavenderia fasciculata TaxID=261658 RepID=F4PTD7_CACFS|nr:uncharacterized protein DFA_01545 [Cavenderia fasciculata]EGG21659.1 hypothetical protein DFA_01545 [Cavenderia fasciculata]|eukprot:XP_004359509.1 hypothetical protein DFA_01545 [Cavenderia fasciculata]
MASRVVSKIAKGIPTSDGAGVKLKRVIGGPISDLDPFLLLDEFKSDKKDDYIAGFPSHPHRGFETVTYMLAGSMEHKDHKGNKGLLRPGSIQWMTAGKGIIHSELPKQEQGLMHGFQLWCNLPKTHKMMEPRYQDIPPKDVPVVESDGVKVKVLAGTYRGTVGPVSGVITNPLYLDVELSPGSKFSEEIPTGHSAFAYVFQGSGFFGPKGSQKKVEESHIGVLTGTGATHIEATGGDDGCRFILVAGAPINEPIARYGPFVMNTEAEIKQAFDDYRNERMSNLIKFWEKGTKIVAVARNYVAHAKELGNEVPSEPFFFLKPKSSYCLQGSPIEIPKQTNDVHHEIELGVVIGKKGKDIDASNAMDFVGGYALAIDLTARDLQSKAKQQGQCWTIAKGFDTFCPVSDFIPKEKIANPSKVELWLSVDDVVKQKDYTDKMIFGIPELIQSISRVMTLEEGDLILTGTPSGVGPIKVGQKIKCGITGVAEMQFDVVQRNTIHREREMKKFNKKKMAPTTVANPIKQRQSGEAKKNRPPTIYQKKKQRAPMSVRGKDGELEDVDDISIKEYKRSEENSLKRLRNHVYEGGDGFDNFDILDDASNTVFAYATDDIASTEILGPDQLHLNKHKVKKSKLEQDMEKEMDDEINLKGMTPKLSKKEKLKKRIRDRMELAKNIHFAKLPSVQRKFWKETVKMPLAEQLAVRKRLKVKIERTITSELTGSLVSIEGQAEQQPVKSQKGLRSPLPRPIVSLDDVDIPKSMMKFIDFLRNKYSAIKEPTPVQSQAWSAVMTGNDVLTIAQTGSGKTLGYLLPAIPHVLAQMKQRSGLQVKGMPPIRGPIVLIIVPTRELAQQVDAVCKPLRSKLGIHSLAIYGGVKSYEQKEILSQEHNEIVIATPGRLVDLIQRSEEVVGLLSRVSLLIFDEADRMLQLGFGDQLQKISEQIRPDRQTLMFSATFAKTMQEASTKWLKNPLKIRVKSSSANEENTAVITKNVKQVVKVIKEDQRQDYLFKFLDSIFTKETTMRNRSLILIFVNHVRSVKPLSLAIEKMLTKQSRKYKCGAIHGDLKQHERDQVINDFKAGKMTVLVATDILGRGIHINNLRFVINYDFPTSLEQYIHRVGRTGRQGNKGHALTLYCDIPQNQTFAKGLVRILEECSQQVDPQLRVLAESYFGDSEQVPLLKTEEEEIKDEDDSDDEETTTSTTSTTSTTVKVKNEPLDDNIANMFDWKKIAGDDNDEIENEDFGDEFVQDSDEDDEDDDDDEDEDDEDFEEEDFEEEEEEQEEDDE